MFTVPKPKRCECDRVLRERRAADGTVVLVCPRCDCVDGEQQAGVS